MIANTFEVLVKQLDAYFESAPSRVLHDTKSANGFDSHSISAINPGGDNDPKVKIMSFLRQEDLQESIKFPLNKVTPILINIEEESKLRQADRFSRISQEGKREQVYPDVRLNLYVLFVSNFFDYTDSLYYLGLIVKYFQSHPILNQQNTPGLHAEIEQLIVELISLPFAEQNEVWNALRSAYHPSMLYKVKMLVFQDQSAVLGAGEIKKVETNLGDSP